MLSCNFPGLVFYVDGDRYTAVCIYMYVTHTAVRECDPPPKLYCSDHDKTCTNGLYSTRRSRRRWSSDFAMTAKPRVASTRLRRARSCCQSCSCSPRACLGACERVWPLRGSVFDPVFSEIFVIKFPFFWYFFQKKIFKVQKNIFNFRIFILEILYCVSRLWESVRSVWVRFSSGRSSSTYMC